MTNTKRGASYLTPQTGRRARHLGSLNLYKSCVLCPLLIPSSARSPDHDPRRTIYCLGYPLGRFAGLKHRQLARQVGVIITTGRRRTSWSTSIYSMLRVRRPNRQLTMFVTRRIQFRVWFAPRICRIEFRNGASGPSGKQQQFFVPSRNSAGFTRHCRVACRVSVKTCSKSNSTSQREMKAVSIRNKTAAVSEQSSGRTSHSCQDRAAAISNCCNYARTRALQNSSQLWSCATHASCISNQCWKQNFGALCYVHTRAAPQSLQAQHLLCTTRCTRLWASVFVSWRRKEINLL
jgi:hypothetical protein